MTISAEIGDDKKSVETLSLDDIANVAVIKSVLYNSVEKLNGRISLDTIRPLPMFLGVTGPSFCFAPDAFNPPTKKLDKTTFEKIRGRLSLNISFFLSNYALITVGTCIVVALMNTEMIIYLALVSSCWWFHLFTLKNDIPIVIAGKNLDDIISSRRRSNVLSVATFVVVVFYCLIPFLSMMSISGFLICSHALMRDPRHIESSSMLSSDSENEEDYSSGGEVIVNKGDIC